DVTVPTNTAREPRRQLSRRGEGGSVAAITATATETRPPTTDTRPDQPIAMSLFNTRERDLTHAAAWPLLDDAHARADPPRPSSSPASPGRVRRRRREHRPVRLGVGDRRRHRRGHGGRE